ncbi:hypothetical protein DLAC_04669 [Tieghemostelium lacteum]|uniref:EamA domain-containing protein n=1 Tax=Tieghemostelium lacteum TaxID=361077 RepID=A0A151ZK49_TIELA|nr:hypothetical protein DLAC_04669 [Tieghemostelium lacteum]|eukprot:KYQ94371.1 hypothetical protein DLAC_04669 [Tieghemostelium lacteum]
MDLTMWGRFKAEVKQIDRETIKTHAMLLSIQLVFSVFYILAKVALKNIPAFLFLMIRLVIATPLLWLLALVTARDQIFILPTKREWLFLCISGFFAVTVNQSLFLVGLTLSTASNAAITQPAIPIFSTLFAVLIGYEKKTAMKFIGIGVAVVGAILMIDFTHLKSDSQSSRDIVLGNLCFFGNTIAYAIFLLSQRPLVVTGGMNPAKCTAWGFLIGTPIVVIICFSTTKNIDAAFSDINLFSWLVILYTAIFATAYTFWASSVSVGKTDPTTVAVYLTVEPLATTIMARIFLDESLTVLNILGGFVILAGVATVMVSKHKEKKKEKLDQYERKKLKDIEMENDQLQLQQYTLQAQEILNGASKTSLYDQIDNNDSFDNGATTSTSINNHHNSTSVMDDDNDTVLKSDDVQIVNELNEDEDSALFIKNSNNKY